MLIVVSPAKSLDYESKLATRKRSEPRLLDRSRELVEVMAQKSPQQLSTLMSISPSLGELNHERFQDWETPFTPENSRPAVLAFNGDVYLGMEPQTFSERDFTHAQKTLRILSGLYGVLRPLDLMQPYRLEMGSRVLLLAARICTAFGVIRSPMCSTPISRRVPGARALINLASNEYFGAVNTKQLEARLVSPVFLDSKNGAEPKIVSFFAKRARGSMAGWIIRNRVSSVRALMEFDEDGYSYEPDRSDPNRPVFVRYNRS